MPPVTTHAYGDHPHHFTELHRPDGGGPVPVAVVVHGGFWMTENGGADRMTGLCEDLAARGWAAYNVEYRRLGCGGTAAGRRPPRTGRSAWARAARSSASELTVA